MTDNERQRYARHISLDGVGAEGQERLLKARVLIVGAGGLGSPVAMYLAAAGVGRIGIIDADAADVSNLQRQVIHFTADAGRPKVESAKEKMLQINPDITVDAYHELLTPANADRLLAGYDMVVDATDNFAAKFLVNDTCCRLALPFVYAGVLRFSGQVMTHTPGTADLRSVFGPEPPAGFVPNARQAGVLGPVVGMLGTIQATEVLKYLTGAGRLLTNRLLTVDTLTMDFKVISL